MHTHKLYNERKLVELLAEGSEYAFTRVFDRYRPRVLGTALRFLKSQELAEEVVQEVFLKLWLRREDLKGVLNFEGYLFTMARNQIFDCLKGLAREAAAKTQLSYGLENLDDSSNALLEEQYGELLNNVVNQLPPQQKQIFRLAKMEGLSHQAIAERLHISRLTVKTHMAKALQTIRHNLKQHLITFVYLPVLLRIFNEQL